jgi:hypothetical protein
VLRFVEAAAPVFPLSDTDGRVRSMA